MEFTTTISVPFCWMAFSTASAVRVSSMPAAVSSWRMGATIPSGYIRLSPFDSVLTPYFTKVLVI
jgi:hypothetical protein